MPSRRRSVAREGPTPFTYWTASSRDFFSCAVPALVAPARVTYNSLHDNVSFATLVQLFERVHNGGTWNEPSMRHMRQGPHGGSSREPCAQPDQAALASQLAEDPYRTGGKGEGGLRVRVLHPDRQGSQGCLICISRAGSTRASQRPGDGSSITAGPSFFVSRRVERGFTNNSRCTR